MAAEELARGAATPLLVRAETQSAGRGRRGRSWLDQPGSALLMSLGLRADSLPAEPERAWRVGAEFALAVADAVEDAAGLMIGSVALKWPNDLVLRRQDGGITTGYRKVGGTLMEAAQLGTPEATLIVGLGLNVRGDPARLDPALAETATSLELATGRPVDREALFDDALVRLDGRLAALRSGRFDVAGWRERQLLEGWEVALDCGETGPLEGHVVGFDGGTGALILSVGGTERAVSTGEVARVVRAATP